jgi:Tfp pilus assembly protein PilF
MARVRLADMLLALSELNQAEQQYAQVAAASPGEPHVQLGLAKLAVARNHPREAIQHLAAIADDPLVRSRACALRASLYERLGDKTAAEGERQRLAALPGDSLRPDDDVAEVIKRQIGVRALIAKAEELWREKRTRQMVALMRKAVQRYPQSDVAWASLATALSATGDLEGSEQALRRSIELAPKTAGYRVRLGKLLTGQRRFEEAQQELRAAVSLNPKHGPAHLALGECLLEQGDEKGAAESFAATLRHAPGDAAARRYLDQLGSSRGSE